MEPILLATSVLLLLYWYFTRNFNHWKNKNVPFNKPIPFFGNMMEGVTLRRSFGEIFLDVYEKTKEPIFGLYVLDRPCLLLRDPKIIKKILISDFQYFYDRSIMNNKRDDPIGTQILFILNNPEWKELRTKITPIYTLSKMKTMSKLIESSVQEMTNYITEESARNPEVEMKEVLIKFTINVITSTAFGVNADTFKNKKSPFYLEAKKLINWDDFFTSFRIRCYFLAPTIVKLFRIKFLNPGPVKFLAENFWNVMDKRASSTIRRNDLVDILLELKEEDKYFTESNLLASQAVMFFVAGFETSSSTLSFALHEMALNQEIQTKLREEIVQISEKHGGINYEALKEMEYLDMCIKEVLRKYPVVPVLERKCTSTYTISETGTTIEKDTSVFISILGLHYDPQYFPEPEKFDPERFSPENKSNIVNCSYLPFGEGPRNCLGARFGLMTVKYGLANILKNFVLEPTPQTPKKILFNKNCLVLSALHEIKLKVSKV